MDNLKFLKLGGSLITDKTGVEVVRRDVLKRLAKEIKQAKDNNPNLRLLLGHGSGSFGHVAGAKYATREGVHTPVQWWGFVEVSSAASRLNDFVMAALLDAGVPALSLQPSASAVCVDGDIESLASQPVEMAINAGLIPVIYGDVAFDRIRGGTIISTEEIMMVLAAKLNPTWLLLAGETPGVFDLNRRVIPSITEANFADIAEALGGSRGTDVTGGMSSKVRAMLDLVVKEPEMKIRIFSGLEQGNILSTLLASQFELGTIIQS